jgi:hypothetical protein
MSVNKHEDRALPLTARPKSYSDEHVQQEHEVGLSIDPEDLGQWALRSAAQEDVHPAGADEPLSITGAAPSDDALTGPNYSSSDGVWGQSINAALQAGGIDATRESRESPWIVDEDDEEDADEESEGEPDELDYRDNRVREMSLLDRPTGQGDETITPELVGDAGDHDEASFDADEADEVSAGPEDKLDDDD